VLANRPMQILVTFLVLRAGEVAALTLGLMLAGGAQAVVKHADDWPVSVQGELHAAWIVVRTYYFWFGYFYLSAIVFLLLVAFRGIRSSKGLGIANAGPFAVHSLVVILLVFGGRFSLVLWAVWLAALSVNWLLPKLLWNVTFRGRPPDTIA